MLVNARRLETSPIPYVVDRMLPEVGAGFAHGPSSIGKSYALVTRLALDVANGVPYFGHDTIQGTVIIALGEGLQDAGIRIKAQLAQHAEDDAARVEEVRLTEDQEAAEKFAASLPAYTDDFVVVETERFAIPFDAKGKPSVSMQRFIASVSGIGPTLVIFDAMADFTGGASITNETTANRFSDGIKYLVSQLDCFVLGIGHDTQDGSKMKGSGRFFEAADVMMSVKPESGGDLVSVITSEKAKSGPKFEPISYRAVPKTWDEPVLDDHGRPTGETELVETHVVVQAEDDESDTGFVMPDAAHMLPPLELPVLRDATSAGPQRRKRNGVRAPAPTTLAKFDEFVAAKLADPCDECGAPAGRSCNPLPGSIFSTIAPEVDVHDSRVTQTREPA